MNLRAALLRQLTELKKDGVLGPNITLRKTMLDECKGDKFEELLAAFSIVVLKKIAKAQTLVRKENQVPLVLSYRRGIQRDLEKRKEIDLNARQQHRAIEASHAIWSEQAAALRHKKTPRVPENADMIRSTLRENWIGDYTWTDAILNGIPIRNDEERISEGDSSDPTLLEDLQARVQIQNAQLLKWQTYLKDLQQQIQSGENQDHASVPAETPVASTFTRHQDLRRYANRQVEKSIEPRLKPHHASLIQSLEAELRPIRTTSNLPEIQTTPRSLRTIKPSSIQVTPSRKPTEQTHDPESPTTPRAPQNHFLSERTRLSLASFETPKAKAQTTNDSRTRSIQRSQTDATVLTASTNTRSDRSSLLDRTRQSMSMLTNVLEDPWQSRPSQKTKKPTHKRSKTLNVAPQRGRLSRAWSEESLSSAATSKDDSFNVDAEHDDVFKSRPRLAMSPNLSPQRTESDAWLESQLEQSMNKLTIDSSPEY